MRWRIVLICASVGMAVAAWAMFIVFQAAHRPAESVTWIAAAGWPFYYGVSLAGGMRAMRVGRSGTAGSRGLPPMYAVAYGVVGPLLLILVPAAGVVMGVMMMVSLATQ